MVEAQHDLPLNKLTLGQRENKVELTPKEPQFYHLARKPLNWEDCHYEMGLCDEEEAIF